jgi:type I restriction enzyme, S subunit
VIGLPHGWARIALSGLVSPAGLFSDGDWVESKDQDANGSIRLLQLADVGDGIFLNKSSRFVNEEQFKRLRCTEVLEGDILIARMPDPLGRACLAPRLPQRCITVVDVAILRPGNALVHTAWAMHALNAPQVRTQIDLESTGTTRRRIARGKLASFELPVPPVNEQKRIADKLDAVLSRTDACRDHLDRVPEILKRFRQSVLAAAMSGALTEEWRSALGQRSQNCSSDPESAAEISSELPKSWRWRRLADVTSNFDARRVPIKAGDRSKRRGQYPYYGAFGAIDTIDDFLFDGEFLLLAEDGKNLESRDRPIALVAQGRFWVNNHAHVMQPKSMILINYLSFWLNSSALDLSGLLTGIDQVKLTRGAMDRIPVPVPPLDEQAEVIRRVESLFAWADRLEGRHKTARARVERLTPALLAKAFRGELVSQDPADEPASELLKRLGQWPADNSTGLPKSQGAKPGRANAARTAAST